METPGEGGSKGGESRTTQLLAKALTELAAPGPHAPKRDLLDGLDALEERVARQREAGSPGRDWDALMVELIDIRVTRIRAQAKNETRGEHIWLFGRVAVAVLAFALAWGAFA